MSSAVTAVVPRPLREARKGSWGYFVWVVAGIVIVIPELIAAAAGNVLPFTTISAMVGHLERHHPWVELVVVAAIVLAVFAMMRAKDGRDGGKSPEPPRRPSGRLTVREPRQVSDEDYNKEEAPGWFAVAAFPTLLGIAAATWAASWWWDDGSHYPPAYVLYGLLALIWLVVPTVVALVWKDPPFPTLFRSVRSLEESLRNRAWPHSLGPVAAWLVGYVLLAGLVILLLHLALYPYPDITHILNPGG
jgi:hypothetical protein